MTEKIQPDDVRPEHVSITPFEDKYRDAWRDINVEWLEAFFYVEEEDRKNLDQPEKYILQKGGEIYLALLNGEPIGVVALKYYGDGRYEVSKMGVRPAAQGYGIGAKLLKIVIERYHARGGRKLYLETHSKLQSAIRLYKRYGFVEVPIRDDTPYERADYGMIYQEELY